MHADDPLALDYWVERNSNSNGETSTQTLPPRSSAALDSMRAGPTLSDLHRAAVAWREARFDVWMLQGHFRAFYRRLPMTPPSHPISRIEAAKLVDFTLQDRKNCNN